NINLSPFKATNYDFDAEWYFGRGGLLTAAVFRKDVSNFPQTVTFDSSLQNLISADEFAGLLTNSNDNQRAFLTTGNGGQPGLFAVKQFQNSPGGTIDGYEIAYQQDLTFLPGFLSNLGVIVNFTHISSKLQYIIDPGTSPAQEASGVKHRPVQFAPGPFL